MNNGEQTKTIAKNTVFLYIRLLIVMFINLFSVRLILNGLGEEDYGIYNVVAGVVTMLGFVSSVLSTATQRFYSYSLGERNSFRLKEIYSVSLKINIIFSVIVLLIGETLGLWFINLKLVIPVERLFAANVIYQCSIVAFVLSLLQVPYSAAVIAHEHMGFFAVTSLAESIARFIVAYSLTFLTIDKLSYYGLGLLLVSCLTFLVYYLFAHRKYQECRYIKTGNKQLYKEIFSFSGWTLFGSVANVSMFQINTILINLFFGPLVNASRAISISIYSAMSLFSGSFITALRPAMIKAYAEENDIYVLKLFSLCSSAIFYLMLLIGVPLLSEMELILKLWLGNSNPDAVLFSRLIVIYSIILSLHNPFTIVMQAMGKTKEYFVPVEIFTLLSMPATYLLYKLGLPAEYTYYTMITSVILSHIMRIICLKHYYEQFDVISYIKDFCFPALFVIVLTMSIIIYSQSILPFTNLLHIGCVTIISTICILLLAFFIGIKRYERIYIKQMLKNILNKWYDKNF